MTWKCSNIKGENIHILEEQEIRGVLGEIFKQMGLAHAVRAHEVTDLQPILGWKIIELTH